MQYHFLLNLQKSSGNLCLVAFDLYHRIPSVFLSSQLDATEIEHNKIAYKDAVRVQALSTRNDTSNQHRRFHGKLSSCVCKKMLENLFGTKAVHKTSLVWFLTLRFMTDPNTKVHFR